MEITRQAHISVVYNGTEITESIAKDIGAFQFIDIASGSSDSISVSIDDNADIWLNAWYPSTGDSISANIRISNWRHTGDNRFQKCGIFTLDDPTFSGDPATCTLRAVSQPASDSFMVTERTKTWEKATVQQIAAEIAGNSNLILDYGADEITVEIEEQSGETDSKFLMSLCEEYGLSLKIYSHKLVIFDREKYKKKPAIATLFRQDAKGVPIDCVVKSWSFNPTLEGTYTGGTIKYTDPYTEKDVTHKLGSGSRLLNLNTKADNEADAEKQLKAAINNANHDAFKMSVTTMGNPSLVSGQTVNISGFGQADGKYYINQVVHNIGSGGYQCIYNLSKVTESF